MADEKKKEVPKITMEKVLNYLVEVSFALHAKQVGHSVAVEVFHGYMGFYPEGCEPDTEEGDHYDQ